MLHDSGLSPWREQDTGTKATKGRRSRWELMDRAQAIRSLTGPGSVVYALMLTDGTVKIGCTKNLAARKNHYPGCEIVGFMAGDHADELAIHHSLVAHRARGREYYHPTPEVLAVVNDMREEFGLPPLAA